MPTFDYRLADGTRVPGVTTVLKNLGWSTENLIRWANKQGLMGVDVRGPRAQRAADIGTLIHALIEADLKGTDPAAVEIPDDMAVQVAQGKSSFDRWREQTQIQIVESEWAFVDEEFRTGGCVDGIGEETDGESILDWKTGGGPYPEHLIQVGAYAKFRSRKTGRPIIGAHVCRFGKDSGIFHQVFFPAEVLEHAWTAFTWARALHEMRPRIEGYVR